MALPTLCLLALIVGNAVALASAGSPTALNSLKAEPQPAKAAKMAAVNKVLSMLEDIQSEVVKEGEKEAASYNKFACFCKDTTADKTAAIDKGGDSRDTLSADIGELSSKRDGLDADIQQIQADIKQADGEMKEADKSRSADLALYTKNVKDLSAALEGLTGAIKMLKASKGPALLQNKDLGKSLQGAVLLADAMGLGGKSTQRLAAMFLQQAPEVPMQDYDFHSGDIIESLEKLLTDFRAEKSTLDKEEVSAVAVHESFMQEKTDYVKAKNVALEKAKKSKSDATAEIETKSEELSTVEATLKDDKQYLMTLSKMCSDKAKTWDQRTKVRSDELAALTAAIGIIESQVSEKTTAATIRFAQTGANLRRAEATARNDVAMQALESVAEAADESAAPSLLQQARAQRHGGFLARARRHEGAPAEGPRAVADFLRSQGRSLRSSLLVSLASKVAGDPLAKVKTLIQELIERLLQEAANEANQKGWCDKSIADAKQKRGYAAEEILALNGKMAKLEATRDKLTEELQELTETYNGLRSERFEVRALREEEKTEHGLTVKEANAGLEAVTAAMDILYKFYATAKKDTVDISLAERDPADEAPDAGFDNGEAYTGSQDSAGGVMGMLDVIKSDFVRTIEETEKAEAEAATEHREFETEQAIKLIKTRSLAQQKDKFKRDAEEELGAADDELADQTSILQTSLRELMELKPTCIDTGMSHEDRVAMREDEMAALRKAMCILEGYSEMGPAGAGAEC